MSNHHSREKVMKQKTYLSPKNMMTWTSSAAKITPQTQVQHVV